ncbi:MAG TPA: ATP-binding protein [Planctomycetota bacterium]|nr:ATP-binding protein [Planctomycetota bacterium]
MAYIERSAEEAVRRAAREFPIVALTGPRQSGKTTLLQHLFGRSHGYRSLELPDVRAAAASDPRGFLALNPPPVIFDEIQHAPGLLPYIKEAVDARRNRSGQFILSGSQNLLVAQGVTESLAGRVAVLKLLPLSYREIAGLPNAPLPWEPGRKARREPMAPRDLWLSFLRGGYPELVANPGRDLSLWHASYVQTYLERDVRSLRQVGDLSQFQIFLRALAAHAAQLLNLASLSRDLGVAVNTVKAWLSVLEATYQVIVLRPYYGNVGKRLVKTPKLYFADLGTLCYLAGLKDPDHAMAGPMGGALFENAVLIEVLRALTHRGQEPQVYFWRTAAGVEVDFVVDAGETLVPIEVKLSTTPNPAMASGINAFKSDFGDRVAKGYIVHPGDTSLPLGPNTLALPFGTL